MIKYAYALFVIQGEITMRPIRKIKTIYYSKAILTYLLLAGALVLTGSSLYITPRAISKIFHNLTSAEKKRKISSSFSYLKRKGLIEIRRVGHDVEIFLTPEGKKRAGKYQINDLTIPSPKRWDRKWRVVVFDIPAASNLIRDVLRRKLKEFGFYPLQKSVWIFPFDCREEIHFLREFLGAKKWEIRVLEVDKIDGEEELLSRFHLDR